MFWASVTASLSDCHYEAGVIYSKNMLLARITALQANGIAINVTQE